MRLVIFIFAIVFTVMVAGCEGDKESFSGLSDLVAKRTEVRQTISKQAGQGKKGNIQPQTYGLKDSKTLPHKVSDEAISVAILYEKEIEIVDSQSGISLAKGRAYMNKQGRIIKIKILSN